MQRSMTARWIALGLSATLAVVAGCGGATPPPEETPGPGTEAALQGDSDATPGEPGDPPALNPPNMEGEGEPPLPKAEADALLTKVLNLAKKVVADVNAVQGCDAKAARIKAVREENKADVAEIKEKMARVSKADRDAFTAAHKADADELENAFGAIEKECGDNEAFKEAIASGATGM